MTTAAGQGTKMAYVMSRFPKVTETFILYEMVMVERLGTPVEVFPLLRERGGVVHKEAEPYIRRAHYLPFVSLSILLTNLRTLRRRPRLYATVLWEIMKGTFGSLNFFVGGLGIFAKCVHASAVLQRSGVAHVHCHFATHPAVAGLVISRLTGIPFSFTAHGSDLHVDRHMLPQKVQAARFVVAVSDENRRIITAECAEGDRAKVHVVHCGVDTSVFAPVPRRERGGFAILCVGTLHEVKGQRHLIEAIRALTTHGVGVTCTLVGSGPDRAALEQQVASLDLADRVFFAGAVDRDGVVALLQEATVLVAPSVPTPRGKREGIPVVLMEAMATGCPVVASRLSGIPELVEAEVSGLLVPPGDVAALAGALRRLHDDPELRSRLGAAARERVVAEFDVRENASRLLELVRSATVT